MAELQLSEIWIYPVKSLGGIRVDRARVKEKGLHNDRRWMLVDENGMFMTQRAHPALALFKVKELSDAFIKVQADSHSIDIPTAAGGEPIAVTVTVWNDKVTAQEVDPQISRWFSERLQKKCMLVYFPEENARPVDSLYSVNNEHVSLADAYPFLIIGQASLDFLNTKLIESLPMNRFRPNFVFTGGEPHEEDTWRNFSIGNNRFMGVKPCDRCVLTTINQDSAVKGDEPLRTLATYRKRDHKIYFGQNLLAVDEGEVRIGDTITIQTRL
jgi:uncharacterized protein